MRNKRDCFEIYRVFSQHYCITSLPLFNDPKIMFANIIQNFLGLSKTAPPFQISGYAPVSRAYECFQLDGKTETFKRTE